MIEVKDISSYRRRPYEDTKYEYEVTTDEMNEEEVKRYCTEQVRRCSKSETEEHWLEPYYQFRKVSENKYRYTVIEPYFD